jgi:hypothetical protein
MKFEFEGHQIDVAEAEEFGDLAGKPIPMQFGSDGRLSASIPLHSTKSTLAKYAMEGENLPRDEYWLLLPPGADRKHLGLSEIRQLRRPKWTAKDFGHHIELFDAVGRISVYGGHVEMAMKKVLITLSRRRTWSPAMPRRSPR